MLVQTGLGRHDKGTSLYVPSTVGNFNNSLNILKFIRWSILNMRNEIAISWSLKVPSQSTCRELKNSIIRRPYDVHCMLMYSVHPTLPIRVNMSSSIPKVLNESVWKYFYSLVFLMARISHLDFCSSLTNWKPLVLADKIRGQASFLLLAEVVALLLAPQKTCCLKMCYRKCMVSVVASNDKYGSCPQGTWFQSMNWTLTLESGKNPL